MLNTVAPLEMRQNNFLRQVKQQFRPACKSWLHRWGYFQKRRQLQRLRRMHRPLISVSWHLPRGTNPQGTPWRKIESPGWILASWLLYSIVTPLYVPRIPETLTKRSFMIIQTQNSWYNHTWIKNECQRWNTTWNDKWNRMRWKYKLNVIIMGYVISEMCS